MFLVTAIYPILWGPEEPLKLVVLSLIMVLATLTQETAVIILSFDATAHFDTLKRPKREVRGIQHSAVAKNNRLEN